MLPAAARNMNKGEHRGESTEEEPKFLETISTLDGREEMKAGIKIFRAFANVMSKFAPKQLYWPLGLYKNHLFLV